MAERRKEVARFTELYEHIVGRRPFVGSLLTGHLAIEFLLRQLVIQYDERLEEHADTLRHHALISLNHRIGTIDVAQRDVLDAINRLRNRFAHRIGFEPSIEDLRQLWARAAIAFDDLTDGISQGIVALASVTRISDIDDWVLPEFLIQICYDLHTEYVDRGGGDEDF